MDCKKFMSQLDEYVSGTLSDDIKSDMSAHADCCDNCRAELDEMQRIVSVLHSMPKIPVSDDFIERLNARIDAESISDTPSKAKSGLFKLRAYTSVAAALLLCAVLVKSVPMLMPYLHPDTGSQSSSKSSVPSAVVEDDAELTEPTYIPNTTAVPDTAEYDSTTADKVFPTQSPTVAAAVQASIPSVAPNMSADTVPASEDNTMPSTAAPTAMSTDKADITDSDVKTQDEKMSSSDLKSDKEEYAAQTESLTDYSAISGSASSSSAATVQPKSLVRAVGGEVEENVYEDCILIADISSRGSMEQVIEPYGGYMLSRDSYDMLISDLYSSDINFDISVSPSADAQYIRLTVIYR